MRLRRALYSSLLALGIDTTAAFHAPPHRLPTRFTRPLAIPTNDRSADGISTRTSRTLPLSMIVGSIARAEYADRPVVVDGGGLRTWSYVGGLGGGGGGGGGWGGRGGAGGGGGRPTPAKIDIWPAFADSHHYYRHQPSYRRLPPLRTLRYRSSLVDQVQIELHTEGRPLEADVEVWNGPDNTPCKFRVYVGGGGSSQAQAKCHHAYTSSSSSALSNLPNLHR